MLTNMSGLVKLGIGQGLGLVALALVAALTLTLTLVGCGGDPPFDLEQLALEPPGAHAVWVRHPEGTASTFYIDEQGDELAVEDGIVLRTPRGVLRWSKRRVPIRTYACEVLGGTRPAGDGWYEEVTLVPAAGAPITVAPLDAREVEASGWINTYSNELKLLGSVGSLLFLLREEYTDGCGAHGNVAAETFVWDLRTGERAELAPELAPADLRRVFNAAPPLLTERVEEAGETLLAEDPPANEELELTGLIPRFTAAGLRLDYQITAGTCYAMTRGNGGSYTRSTLVEAGQLPASLVGHRHLPPAVAAFARSHGGQQIGGHGAF